MSYELWVGLTKEDRQESTTGSAGACLLAVALQRQYGGEWTVSGEIRQQAGGECTWAGRTTLAGQAIIARYDATSTASVNRRVRVAVGKGKFRDKAPRRIEQPRDGYARPWRQPNVMRARLAGGAALLGSAALVLDGLAWVDFTVLGAAAAGLTGLFIRGHVAHNRARTAAGPQTAQKYVHVQQPKTAPATAAVDDRMPAPAPAALGSERLFTSAPPEPLTDPVPAPLPAVTEVA